jgi:hypothetical protein
VLFVLCFRKSGSSNSGQRHHIGNNSCRRSCTRRQLSSSRDVCPARILLTLVQREVLPVSLRKRTKMRGHSRRARSTNWLGRLKTAGLVGVAQNPQSVPRCCTDPQNGWIVGEERIVEEDLNLRVVFGAGLKQTIGPLRRAFLTWISEFLTSRLSMSVSHLRPKLALNPETSKKG